MDNIKAYSGYNTKKILSVFLTAAFIWSLLSINWGPELFHPGGGAIMSQIIQSLFHPNLSLEIIKTGFISSWITLAYAVAGMSLAFILALTFGIMASGVLANSRRRFLSLKTLFRGILGFMRAIHELIWAWLFVASIGLSPFAAIFSLAIPYGGTLGRIYADILKDVPAGPINSLKASGASRLQLLIYGYFPLAKADMISYTMYRFECAVRSSTIMSFVGLGGLGYQIQLALADFKFSQVWTYMFFLTALIILIDLWSTILRRR